MMTMRELNHDICGILGMAMDNNMTQQEVARKCNVAPSTLANKKSQKELATLSFWSVAAMAKLAGYKVVFEKEGGKT